MKNKTETSSGCIVWQKKDNNLLFALGKHSGYHKWVLPKGLVEKNEDNVQTAIRETKEELGIKVKIGDKKPIYIAKYTYLADFKGKVENSRRVAYYAESGGNKTKVKKTVYFYLAKYLSGDISKHGWEMKEAGWFNYKEAYKLLGFKDEKQALKKAYFLLK